MDPASLERIRAICKERSLACSPAREQQALIVEGAQALPNRVGAAPGQYIELDRKCIFVLPGPPGEFKAVLHDHVIPRLREIFQTESGFREKLFMTCGLPEADMITLFEREQFPPAGVDIAFCAAPGRIEVRLSSYDQEKLEQAAARLRTLIKHHIFAQERMTMAQAVGRLLIEKGQTVATAESCTGGMLGAELTDFSGSSRFYKGGIIAYDNDVKDRQLGVAAATLEQQGAVSAETAKQMAAGVRERLQADYGLGITGIAGPSGGTSEKPVGLVYIGLADVRQVTAHEFQFGGGRERVREWSRQMALFLLRERITAH
jgi:nicotinamide-nucleotide amidase